MRAIQQQWLPCDGAAPVDVAFSGSAANATFPSFFFFVCLCEAGHQYITVPVDMQKLQE